MPGAPKKGKSTEAKTVQTGTKMTKLDPPSDYGFVTPPPKGVSKADHYSPVTVVDVEPMTEEEGKIDRRQEKLDKALIVAAKSAVGTARGGKKRKSKRKTRKVKKHGKRRH